MSELATYRDYLDHYRSTLLRQAEGLTPEQLAARSVPPSDLSIGGLVRHMARVEHYWFRMVLDEHLDEERLDSDDPTGGFHRIEPTQASVDEALARFQEWRAYADGTLDRLAGADLGELRTDRHGETAPIRDVLVHMVEEYARHCGHADLLREVLDGTTGL
ncbi:MAG: DinB family protein [Nocardioides sp.]|uniref:DinB family protein n=1 Tax=Nocardioides sp. TaxID=35761 RepID=UPI0039E21607